MLYILNKCEPWSELVFNRGIATHDKLYFPVKFLNHFSYQKSDIFLRAIQCLIYGNLNCIMYWFQYFILLLYTNFTSRPLFFFADNKSILTDSDWKKLWMEAGSVNPSSKTDNSIDASDSPVFDDTEVSQYHWWILLFYSYKYPP